MRLNVHALAAVLAASLAIAGASMPRAAHAHGGAGSHKKATSPRVHVHEDPIAAGARALAEHRFTEALDLGLAARARALEPRDEAAALAIIVDALVETGRYEAAIETLQTIVDSHPGIAALARVSYVRELYGDIAGAADAMREAARSGRSSHEIAWCRVKLGELELARGDLAAAEREASAANAASPGDADALALRARLCALRGDWTGAIAHSRAAIEGRRDPGFFVALGEAYDATGDARAANDAYDAARRLMRDEAAAGTDVDLELIALEIDHPAQGAAAVPVAELVHRARALRDRRPTIFADALLAQLLARAGHDAEARAAAERALRLGSRDPALLDRAAAVLQERSKAAPLSAR